MNWLDATGKAAGGFPIDNIGEVDVYGLELEVVWAPLLARAATTSR